MGRKSVFKVPAFLDCLVGLGIKHLVESTRATADEARSAMYAVTAAVSRQFAREVVYVPDSNPQCRGTAPWLLPGTSELVREFFEFLVTAGVKHLDAAAIGQAPQQQAVMQTIARGVFWRYGRQKLYVPALKEWALQARDQQIFAAYEQDGPGGESRYTGKRLQQIARQHDIGVGQAYNIVKNEVARRKQLAGTGGGASGACAAAASRPADGSAANQEATANCA